MVVNIGHGSGAMRIRLAISLWCQIPIEEVWVGVRVTETEEL